MSFPKHLPVRKKYKFRHKPLDHTCLQIYCPYSLLPLFLDGQISFEMTGFFKVRRLEVEGSKENFSVFFNGTVLMLLKLLHHLLKSCVKPGLLLERVLKKGNSLISWKDKRG